MLNVSDLAVRQGGRVMVSGLSFSLKPGEVTAVLGANGAGKSELVLGLAGMLPITAGSYSADGEELAGKGPDVIRASGVAAVPEGHRVFTALSVDDNLRAAGAALDGAALEASLADTYGIFPELAERKGQLAGTMSGGQQQMLALGHALMAVPRYMLIDEMSLGLAPLVVKRLMGVVRELKSRGVGILLIEQFTDLALGVAEQAVVLRSGQAHYTGAPGPLIEDVGLLDAAYFGSDAAAQGAHVGLG